MGKTITVIALILSTSLRRPSLIVSPPALVDHWERQIQQHTEAGRLKVMKINDPDELEGSSAASLQKHDVVLTTFGTLFLYFDHT